MASSPSSDTGPSARLLIVDDDPLIRMLACERLAGEDFEVVDAANGREGLEAFGRMRPDLLLLDVEMPEIDGFEVCQAIRRSPGGMHVPIVILTGRDDVESIQRAYDVGATDFASKPLNWTILTHRIRYILRASDSFDEVRAQRTRLDEVQRYAKLGSWEVDLRSGELSTSSALRTIVDLGRTPDPIAAPKILDHVHPEDREPLERAAAGAIENRDGFVLEHRVISPEGKERIVHTQGTVRLGDRDECTALEGFSQDITERRATEERVRFLAFNDSLTGLANRAAFKLQLASAIQRSHRTANMLGVLYLDVDQFKRINDTFGHTAGDRLLQYIAQKLQEAIRDTDFAARNTDRVTDAMISRLGGDEFTILLEGLSTPSDAALVAQRILESLDVPVLVEGQSLRVTVSTGIAIWPHDGGDVESLLRNADAAMYHAKENGRANFQFYRREFNSDALERLELEANLGRAIEDDRLIVHYQPKVELATERLTGCEALVRWADPLGVTVEPSEFVPLAESSGLIVGLGESVLRQACQGVLELQRSGHADFRLAVNLSPNQINDDNLLPLVDRVLEETGFRPDLLEFEITESALIQDEIKTHRVLDALRERQMQISLDDFGTGYSSLINLKHFPVDLIKIDHCFIAGLGRSRADEAIVASILSMGQGLGIRIVAEGIETREQLEFLKDRGCDEIQGFLVSEALDVPSLAAFLRANDGRWSTK